MNVLIVEDSATVREFLSAALGAFEDIRIIATANDGESAIELARRKKPDIITMDVHMPGMDGFEATRRIMETAPTPIVIVSGSVDTREMAIGFRALEAGALAILPRPQGFGSPRHDQEIRELVNTLRAMSEVKVVKRWPQLRKSGAAAAAHLTEAVKPNLPPALVAVGASTGGPIALKLLLSGLSKKFPVPIAMVQHMAEGFTEGFCEWLAGVTGFPVQVARHGDGMRPGRAYLAPYGLHMTVTSGGVILLNAEPPENGLRPAVSQLFRSVADNYGSRAIGVLLTGMGKDGAEELLRMRERGAATFAQDKQSSVVHGMPGEAIRMGGAEHVLPPEDIASVLERLVARK